MRSRILGAFELAEQQSDPAERRAWLNFAVVGASPTGVELAGQIALLAHGVLRGEYRNIDPSTAEVLLFDATPNVLGAFPHGLGERAARDVPHLGVDVELSAPVTQIDADGLTIGSDGDSRHIPARTVIWAAGVKASEHAATSRTAAEPSLTAPAAFTSSRICRCEDIPRCSRSGT